ncbi:MAG: hypothetical protein COW65_12090 [Cytophagales bacterium CG18_big_fil_WC_8_21_14_2_50_42_9]|nr:MAG: hypothetical protein COW65_12090 [Cytophagales bacterium CG18_big_fil_WC_8_21_14_2_50_42_9]
MFSGQVIMLRAPVLLFLLICLGVVGCTKEMQSHLADKDYLYQLLKKASGRKLTGTIIYPAGAEAPFKGLNIWLEVNAKDKSEIRLPVHTGSKIYRTLVLGQDETGYWLIHENKKADGTHAEISLYGGHTAEVSSPFLLYFMPDVYTRHLLGTDQRNWSLALSSDGSILSYIAEDEGRLMMQIDFDLEQPWPLASIYGNKSEESPKLRKR